MNAFHSDPAVKEKYIARVRRHREMDQLIRGKGWNGEKGCAVGCTLEAYDHSLYPIELGIPEWLAHVEDALFEGMSEEKSRSWPEEFLAAIPVGADLERVKGKFLILVVERAFTTFDHKASPNLKSAIDRVIACWRNPNTTQNEFEAASQAASAVWASARAGWTAAEAAAWEAAWAASAWASVAWAAAWGAWAAARSASASAEAYDYFADELLKLLRDAK